MQPYYTLPVSRAHVPRTPSLSGPAPPRLGAPHPIQCPPTSFTHDRSTAPQNVNVGLSTMSMSRIVGLTHVSGPSLARRPPWLCAWRSTTRAPSLQLPATAASTPPSSTSWSGRRTLGSSAGGGSSSRRVRPRTCAAFVRACACACTHVQHMHDCMDGDALKCAPHVQVAGWSLAETVSWPAGRKAVLVCP